MSDNNQQQQSTGVQRYASYLPGKVTAEQLIRLDTVARDFRELVTANRDNPSGVILRAAAMQTLRSLLTDEIMSPIMALQGSKLGFITDRDKYRDKRTGEWLPGKGYDVNTVRDVTLWAWGCQARMTDNEVNILSGSGYLTKNYFMRRLDELYPASWYVRTAIPTRVYDKSGKCLGANVSGELCWKDSAGEHKQTLIRSLKGDDYSGVDFYIGKFERKAYKLILELSTGEQYADGDADEPLDITATPVTEPEPPKGGIFGARKTPVPSPSDKSVPSDRPDDPLADLSPDCPVSADAIRDFARRHNTTVTRANLPVMINDCLDEMDNEEARR